MTTYAVGDIHGCLTAMETLLNRLPLRDDDQLVFLGDLIDRGPDSCGVIELIQRLRKERPVQIVRGNHEEMLLLSRVDDVYCRAWLRFGGKEMLDSYGYQRADGNPWPTAVPDAHWQFFEHDLVDYVETATHILVHGSLRPDLTLNEQPWNDLRWEKWNDPQPHDSGKIVVCGHTPQVKGVPLSVGHTICIDTWVYGTGWLTALNLATGEYYQANQSGDSRSATLPPVTSTRPEC